MKRTQNYEMERGELIFNQEFRIMRKGGEHRGVELNLDGFRRYNLVEQ